MEPSQCLSVSYEHGLGLLIPGLVWSRPSHGGAYRLVEPSQCLSVSILLGIYEHDLGLLEFCQPPLLTIPGYGAVWAVHVPNSDLWVVVPNTDLWVVQVPNRDLWALQVPNRDLLFLQGSFVLQPDQIQVLNSVLILCIVPFLESVIFPCMDRYNLPNRLLSSPLLT